MNFSFLSILLVMTFFLCPIDDAVGSNFELTESPAGAKNKIAFYRKNIPALQRQLRESTELTETLKQDLLEQKTQTIKLTTELSKNREETEQLTELLRKSSLEMNELKGSLEDIRTELAQRIEAERQLTEKIATLNENLDKESKERSLHQKLMKEQEQQHQELLKEKQELQETIRIYEEDIQNKKVLLEEQQEEINQLTQELEEKQELEKTIQIYEEDIQNKKVLLEEQQEEINQLTQKLEEREPDSEGGMDVQGDEISIFVGEDQKSLTEGSSLLPSNSSGILVAQGYKGNLWLQRIGAGIIGVGTGVLITVAVYNSTAIINWLTALFNSSSSD